mmetsp:Transcript_42392/g.48151  ORF Transcript_42392/g.48151 Transcript_42392/m.48151 type:complete len:499 (+) Transcript_42392:324-1820(+)
MSSPTPPSTPINSSPSPSTIGRTFLKQYYNILTTTPDMIYKFYRPSSVLSHGEGNNRTIPTTLESLGEPPAPELKDRFFSWADSSGEPVRFELEHGAIDAQESVGGGVLLVVTGHMYLGDFRKSFCHTFFLNFSAADSKKRQYYVHNDVLRFLQEEAPLKESALASVAEEDEEETETAVELKHETPRQDHELKSDKKSGEARDETHHNNDASVGWRANTAVERLDERDTGSSRSDFKAADVGDDYGGVEEVTVTVTEKSYEDEGEEKDNVHTRETVSMKQDSSDLSEGLRSESSNSKRSAGSWAMIARSGATLNGTATTTTNGINTGTPSPLAPNSMTPEKPVHNEKNQKKEKKEPSPVSVSDTFPKGNDHKQRYKRDPESTLVIKNVPDGTKEADIRILFEPFAVDTKARIIGITVAHRGLAFVDYDSTAPVLAALEKKDQFFLNQKALEVGQKNRSKPNRSSSFGRRSGNNNQRQRNGYRDRSNGRNQRGGNTNKN